MSTAHAEPVGEFSPELLQAIADRPEWKRLLHYEKRFGVIDEHSLVDDPEFFFSSAGKRSALAELEGTLSAYLNPQKSGDDHPQCRFPARYRFLSEQLPELRSRALPVTCARLDEWMVTLDPGKLSLVFPTSYLNNPASLYGHTLLKIDAESYGKDGAILGYGINYAAAANENEGLMFAVKGLLGGYHGYFSILPYYVQLRRYSDIESRDIWEYRLNFTKEEIARMLYHLWELRGTYFDYYFFDENCAYHLLSLLEVGRPSLELTDAFPLWVIPSDTVKAVVSSPDLVEEEKYRPSSGTKLQSYLKNIPPESLQLSNEIVVSRAEYLNSEAFLAFEKERQAELVDLSLDQLDYAIISGKMTPEEGEEVRLKLLSRKSRLPSSNLKPPPTPVSPIHGHGSRRFSIAGGWWEDDLFTELDFRSAYHGLLDPPAGFPRGSEIEFFRISARYREGDDLELERFVPVSITSISPRNEVVQPLSWSFSFGVDRLMTEEHSYAGFLRGGPGVAYELSEGVIFYLLSNFEFELSQEHEHRFVGGAGALAGLLFHYSERTRGLLSARGLHFFLQTEEDLSDVRYEQQYDITRDVGLFGYLRSTYRNHESQFEAVTGVRLTF